MKTSFYSAEELADFGFKNIGNNVLISRKASIYSPQTISIQDNVRIDDFCILSGEINLGSYIHISAYTALYGKYGIECHDYTTISGRTLIYSQSDDYSGEFLTNPMVPENLTNITGGKVRIKKHAIIAAGCIVFPGITIGEGAAVGAMSLVNKNLEEWFIYAGIPAKPIKPRLRGIIDLVKTFE
jgi:galactoside O-acetyltransferase